MCHKELSVGTPSRPSVDTHPDALELLQYSSKEKEVEMKSQPAVTRTYFPMPTVRRWLLGNSNSLRTWPSQSP